MAASSEAFVPLDEISPEVVDDFVSLLAELSSTFAKNVKKDPDTQRAAVENNLTTALDSPDTVVMVRRDEASKRIIATATGNVVLSREGWIDDVVTASKQQGHGLGRRGMASLHEWFAASGINVVRLTSKLSREAAGNLYKSMGYVEAGTVWRAPLNLQIAVPIPGYQGCFEPVNCPIPTGNKAWLYGPELSARPEDFEVGLLAASQTLWLGNIGSANYFATEPVSPELTEALGHAGFEQRKETRLYTREM